MKVKDIIQALSFMDPEDDVVLKHLYTSPEVVMKQIRVYKWNNRVTIDGYQQEKKNVRS